MARFENSMESSFQVLKAGWDLTKQTNTLNSIYDATPYIQIKNSNSGSIERFYFSKDKEIKFFVTEEKYCIGYESGRGNWTVCPNNFRTAPNEEQCLDCQKDDFFSCRKICQGFRCLPTTERAKAICDQKETYLYLTYIAGKFKVGVSLNPIRRWIDQGSMYGSVLYKGYGLESRFYEHTIGTTLNLKLAVSISDKISFLGTKIPSRESVRNEFANNYQFIRKLKLFDMPTDPLVYNLSKYYQNIPDLNQQPLLDNNMIKGTVIGVIGRLLVLKDKNSYYVTNLKEIIGKIITLEKPSNGNYRKQRTMYDF